MTSIAAIFILLTMFQSSSVLSRPLFNNGLDPNKYAATQPALNLVLPGPDSVISTSPPTAKINSGSDHRYLVECDHDHVLDSNKKFIDMGLNKGELKKKLEAKYGPLIFNSLPKGFYIPPSGPSRRTNSMDMN